MQTENRQALIFSISREPVAISSWELTTGISTYNMKWQVHIKILVFYPVQHIQKHNQQEIRKQ